MKKNKYFVLFIKAFLVALIIVNIVYSTNNKPKIKTLIVNNQYNNYYLSSNYLEKVVEKNENFIEDQNEIEDENSSLSTESVEKNLIQEKKEDKPVEKKDNDVKVVEKKENNSNSVEIKDDSKDKESTKEENNQPSNVTYNVIETLTGKISGYGPDCYGCTSNRTSSGRFIGDGQIYYEDKTFGKIRIVAGDKKYPYGTVVKISNYYNEPILAVVLDRGGEVGIEKKFMFDLLFETEKDALKMGSRSYIKFEILRLGY